MLRNSDTTGTMNSIMMTERQGRNPRTGESIPIPAHKAVKFRPGKELREAVSTAR
jgi:DNA-binding protein HU-beta